jgi:hypothetical protein
MVLVCSGVVVAVTSSAVMVQRHKLFVCRAGYFGNIMSGEYAASFLLQLVCLPVR